MSEEMISTRNEEAGFVEFLNDDVATIVREIDNPCAILLDMDTRKVVGYRVYDPIRASSGAAADDGWFALKGDDRLGRCATDDCGGQPSFRLEAGGIGSDYCSGCAESIRAYRRLSSPPPTVEVTATHRHRKRGTDYELIGIGKMQTEKWEQPTPGFAIHVPMSVDGREVAVYRSLDDGHIWVRPREEFEDGRFEALSQNKGEE